MKKNLKSTSRAKECRRQYDSRVVLCHPKVFFSQEKKKETRKSKHAFLKMPDVEKERRLPSVLVRFHRYLAWLLSSCLHVTYVQEREGVVAATCDLFVLIWRLDFLLLCCFLLLFLEHVAITQNIGTTA